MTHSNQAPNRKGSTTVRRLPRFPRPLLFLSALGLLLMAAEARAGVYVGRSVVVRQNVVPARTVIVPPRRVVPSYVVPARRVVPPAYVAPRALRSRVYYR